MQEAMLTVALSRSDSEFLHNMRQCGDCGPAPSVLLPPLREDLRTAEPLLAAISGEDGGDGDAHSVHPAQSCDARSSDAAVSRFVAARPYLVCCVRLSPEKEPHRFVELVEALSTMPGGLEGITPLMVGASDDKYAQVRLQLGGWTPTSLHPRHKAASSQASQCSMCTFIKMQHWGSR
eukprot:363221-Chlamydomonas_euryale.AAC.20